MRAVLAAAALACAAAALCLARTTYGDVSMAGFPDGAITDYDNAVDTPLWILVWTQVGFGVLFLSLAFPRSATRARVVVLLLALTAFVLVALVANLGVPWYFGTHLGLDDGVGG